MDADLKAISRRTCYLALAWVVFWLGGLTSSGRDMTSHTGPPIYYPTESTLTNVLETSAFLLLVATVISFAADMWKRHRSKRSMHL